MENMRFKVGDRVRIKSLDWYNENKNEDGDVWLMTTTHSKYNFLKPQSDFCGKVVTIEEVYRNFYTITDPETDFYWTDEMIEGLVKEEKKPNIIKEAKTYWDSIKDAWICPDGYIFKDENGKVIEAKKIVLEKKKPKYPKTYGECCRVLFVDEHEVVLDYLNKSVKIKDYSFEHLCKLNVLSKLLICRDAYWKIAGEEMGLGKPWEPDWDDDEWPDMYYISFDGKHIDKEKGYPCYNMILTFPTEEMRDAFYEAFKEDIEICKELL